MLLKRSFGFLSALCQFAGQRMDGMAGEMRDSFNIDTRGAEKDSPGSIAPPGSIQIEAKGGELLMTYRWICAKYVARSLFASLFVAAYFAFIGHVLIGLPGFEPVPIEGGVSEFALLGIFTLVAALLIYASLAYLINRTYIRITEDRVAVRHGPVPWPGGRTISTGDIQQLYCAKEEEVLLGFKLGGGSGAGGSSGASYMYVVNANSSSGQKLRLVSHLTEAIQAQFIEQEIERHLRLQNRKVKAELPRDPPPN